MTYVHETYLVFFLHGAGERGEDLDTVVPINESMHMIEAVNKKGGNAQIKILYHTGHDAWVEAYNGDELWKWLLGHNRKDKKS